MKISSLFIYVIKACGATEVDVLRLCPWGPRHDREYMVIDRNGNFLTQRDYPRLALIQPRIERDCLLIRLGGKVEFLLPFKNPNTQLREVTIWGDKVWAYDQGDVASRAFGEFLGVYCRLVKYQPKEHQRLRFSDTLGEQLLVSFADGYHLLVTTKEALADFNSRALNPVPMNRFRPNMVLEGAEPYEEDKWHVLQTPAGIFRGGANCIRCATTLVNQLTGEKDPHDEPLRTLALYRKTLKGVVFGRNFMHPAEGVLRKGDVVTAV